MNQKEKVISRSNDECVVVLVNQWFLDYGNEKWKQEAESCIRSNESISYRQHVINLQLF